MTSDDFLQMFPTSDSAKRFLKDMRWPDGKAYCPHCSSGKVYAIAQGKRYECGEKLCLKRFSVTCGTIFHGSKLCYQKQLYLVFCLLKEENSHKNSRKAGTTQKTSYYFSKKIKQIVGGIQKSEPFVLYFTCVIKYLLHEGDKKKSGGENTATNNDIQQVGQNNNSLNQIDLLNTE